MSKFEQYSDSRKGILSESHDATLWGRRAMPDAKIKLLVVDDDVSIRASFSHIFAQLGYCVRSAEDGISALFEIGQEIPDILLSDLNMPGMSGFDLLCAVRRRFPTIWVIAVSGAFSGTSVPVGVAADAFHAKGSNFGSLLRIVKGSPTLRIR